MGLCCCKTVCDDVVTDYDPRKQVDIQSRTAVVPARLSARVNTTLSSPGVYHGGMRMPTSSTSATTAPTLTFEIRNERIRGVQIKPQNMAISTNRRHAGALSQGACPIIPVNNYLHPMLLEDRQKVVKNNEWLMTLLKSLKVPHIYYLPSTAYALEVLDQRSQNFVTNKLFRNNKFNELYQITCAVRVWNPYLMIQYVLNKLRYREKFKERHLYHGTGVWALNKILTDNFDWRKVEQSWYGKGAYFGNNPYYATHYSKKRQNYTGHYVMIVAKVLVEDGDLCVGSPDIELPTTGHTTVSANGQEVVKYEDATFYPEFVVYFMPRSDVPILRLNADISY